MHRSPLCREQPVCRPQHLGIYEGSSLNVWIGTQCVAGGFLRIRFGTCKGGMFSESPLNRCLDTNLLVLSVRWFWGPQALLPFHLEGTSKHRGVQDKPVVSRQMLWQRVLHKNPDLLRDPGGKAPGLFFSPEVRPRRRLWVLKSHSPLPLDGYPTSRSQR